MSLSSGKRIPRKDLCPPHNGRKTTTKNVAYIKLTKSLCMIKYKQLSEKS
ncbi:hypothetical protein BHM03_00021899 [Ensete ventricosum]|uniref:Uncharacterized protein n=1 Tax=Ensete ventricosum TaxID=4639 RepID=A0A445MG58_ENSVE|nr:hypothetical protein BHM03_00021899 [Ensete ventricosum]